MTPSSDSLQDAYQSQRDQLTKSFVKQSWDVWKTLTPADWWNGAVTIGVSAKLAPAYESFIEAARRLGVSYADSVLQNAGMSPGGEPLDGFIVTRANTTPLEVLERPALAYRHAAVQMPQLRPVSWDELSGTDLATVASWLQSGLDRLRTIATTDMTLASNAAATERWARSGVNDYIRVPHPELSDTGTCGLCIAAATRIYHTRDLMPLHSNCKCGVTVLTNDNDPERNKNAYRQLLDSLYEDAGGKTNLDLMSIKVQTVTNSEIGPVLTAEGAAYSTGDGTYSTPDLAMTNSQMKRILSHYRKMADAYKRILADHSARVEVQLDHRKYELHYDYHVRQALNWYESYIRLLTNRFSLAS
ncbi:hypothetical protein [Bifidobacterium cuniculi]|uniref:Phage protein n=1 Tax=Bifidobacterium cuniculi TaxID=1688 RepID=A0A087AFH5_9BIFI|nr:hypothetical protein [Bifidobacterium cuniculi]KFI57525.1 phage protein [Bifidobacterium cuniculi]